MHIERMINAIDTHTAGEPTRTIIGGIPHIPGESMSEKMQYFQKRYDDIRCALMYEPRGHEVMSGVVITSPCCQDADVGAIFIEVGGYLPMCGHDTIGCCTALINAGMVAVTEPVTTIRLDTPAGLVIANAVVEGQIVKEVTFQNVPAFLYKADLEVYVSGYGNVILDVAYGGNFYALLEVDQVGVQLKPTQAAELVKAAHAVRSAVNEQLRVQHPEKDFIQGVTHVEFYGPPTVPEADAKNAVVILPGSIDRSPCGTGTSAKLAMLHAKGELEKGQEYVHESIIGTIFRAEIVDTACVGEYPAIIPQITGQAYVTGMHQFVIDPADPLRRGFLLSLESDASEGGDRP